MDLKFKDNSKLKLATFTQLEYIESTGTQYIDTGISFPNGFRSVTKLYPTNVSSYKDYAGAYQSQLHNIHRIYDGKWNPCTQNNSGTYYGTVNANTLYTVDMSNANSKFNLIVNGNTLANDVTTPTGYSSLTCWIFALHRTDTTTDYQYYYGRIYEISLYDENNVLKFHGIPARDTNNVVCMYDTVSLSFFYNQGTGVFNAGPIVYKAVPGNILLCNTLFHQNTPYINGYDTMKLIMNYLKTHLDEVKEKYYPTTLLWSNIISTYPEIVQYYNLNHKICVFICDSNDPELCTEDFLQLIEDYPDLIPIIAENPALVLIIAENPEVIHSLVDTEYETVLTSIGSTYVTVKGNGFYITETAKLNIYVPSLSNDCFLIGVSGSPDMDNERQVFYTLGNIYYDYRGRLSTSYSNTGRTKLEIGNKYIKFNDTTILNGNYVTNEITPIDFFIDLTNGIRFYSLKKYTTTKDKLWLVPIQNNGNPCMIDLLTGTKYFNQGTGSFTYSLESKNA